MTSERIQRQIDRLLDEAEAAAGKGEWAIAGHLCGRALTFDPANGDAIALLAVVERGLEQSTPEAGGTAPASESRQPASFANGRYQVKRFLGEGGKKRVYL